MRVLVSALLTIAVYLAWGPLPVLRVNSQVPTMLARCGQLRVRLRRPSRPSSMPFLWALHSELLAGALLDTALRRSCSTLPLEATVNVRLALEKQEDIATALETDAQSVNLQVLADVALLYRISLKTGAPITQSLLRLIDAQRDRHRRERTMAQETASTKATVVVLATLPLLGGFMGFGLGLNPFAWFMQSTLGALCLLVGLALEVLGWLWVRLLIRRAMREA